MSQTTYQQPIKNIVRHKILTQAVNYLTVKRDCSCCVHRSYVRSVADFFKTLDEDEPARKEAGVILPSYITAWENLHDSIIGTKHPADLSVCYLSGPEPENDFNELISLGILPNNIWAFEFCPTTYRDAITTYDNPEYPQPRIVKMSVEHFFKYTPKKFDIVYIDACGAIPSSQHALRIVATLCKYHRLNSPGILLTNFSCPDIENREVLNKYSRIIAIYLLFKKNPDITVSTKDNDVCIEGYPEMESLVKADFSTYYSEFITDMLTDIPSITTPLLRFACLIPSVNLFLNSHSMKLASSVSLDEVNEVRNNSICKFILFIGFLYGRNDHSLIFKDIQMLCKDIMGLGDDVDQLVFASRLYSKIKDKRIELSPEVVEICSYFNKAQNLYQFLDRPSDALFFDVISGQLTYPLHVNTECCERYSYCAKVMRMFTDLVVLDECRYIYEWLPSTHQIVNAMKNKSWQYTFRFALDGLVKQRFNNNNEFFFQGSVIPNSEAGYHAKDRTDRRILEV